MPAFTDAVHSTKRFRLGTRRQVNGNEFIYLKGVASTTAASWVFFDADGTTTLTVANSKGRVAVAMAPTVANTFGWYQIYGKASGKVVTGANNAKVWVTATAGSVDNTDVAVDLVAGAIQRSATASNLATFELNYPVCLNEVYN